MDNRISITKSSDLGLPLIFCKQNEIFNFKHAVLFYDQLKKAIGISFTNKNEKGILTISQSTRNGKTGAKISATSFFKVNNIDPARYKGRYPWKKIEDSQNGTLYVIELEKE